MRYLICSAIVCVLAASTGARAAAPVPVEELKPPADTVLQRQQRASGAYRTLQQLQYDEKLAQQDHANAQEAQRLAQQRADELKQQVDAARGALETARKKTAAARTAYDREVSAADEASRRKQ
jgi:hypothetical protein